MRFAACALSLLLLAGCRSPAPDSTGAAPTDVAMTEVRAGAPLDEMLQQLDRELFQAWNGHMEGADTAHLIRAEEITDRLLEASIPFEWLTGEQYSLQARLRQIQSAADRVMAQWQTRAPADEMLTDMDRLRKDVVRLRHAISRGGGRAPPDIEQLLADSMRERRPVPTQSVTPATPPAVPRDTSGVNSQPSR